MARGGEIKKIGELFSIYRKKLKPPQGIITQTFQEVVADLVGVKIPKNHITYTVTSKTLSFTAPGVVKTEVLLQKKEILVHLKGRLGEGNIPREII